MTNEHTENKEQESTSANPANNASEESMQEVEGSLKDYEEPTPVEVFAKADGSQTAQDLEKLQAALDEAKDKYLRLYADFENQRKQHAKQRQELITGANANLMQALLPVLDDFERAIKAMENAQDIEAVKQGVLLIQEKTIKILGQQGLKPMESAIGQPFDLELHESITQIPAPSEDLKGKVIDELEKGYYLYDKIIRFAKVVIGN